MYFEKIFRPTPEDERRDSFLYYKRTFWLSLLTGVLLFLPFLIESKGVFLYFGDYNAQQIPFYEHCVQMVHDGNFGWDWMTDLGSNFIGSYSYYLLGSPYFWFMCLFPATWAPYLMAPMFVAKFVTAALFSFAYIRRFVRDQHYAVIGALLYSFSGFGIYNIFFNQFHEVIAFFPLLLIGIEELVQNNRKGLFALAVAVNAMMNYFMFAGQVVFCIVYFLVRCSSKTFRITLKSFLLLALEAVLGAMMSMVLFLPAALAILDNPRIGSSYTGWEMLFYMTGGKLHTNRYLSIIECFFFPPDIPSRKNFIIDDNARWASLTAWLPLFGVSGVVAYIRKRRATWLTTLLIVLFLMALIPLGNSTFFLLNRSYYARWYYMMILMMSLATVIALDKKAVFRSGLIVCGTVCTAFTVLLGLTWKFDEESETVKYVLGQPEFIDRFWVNVVIAFAGIVAVYILTKYYRGRAGFDRLLSYVLILSTLVYGWTHIFYGKCHSWGTDFLLDQAIGGWESMYPEMVEPAVQKLKLSDSGEGEAVLDVSEAVAGETVTLTCTPYSGSTVESVTVNGSKFETAAPTYLIEVPNGGLNISVTFVSEDEFTGESTQEPYRIELPDTSVDIEGGNDFYRIDTYDGSLDNLGMYWQMNSIRCFHTVVPPSIMTAYPEIAGVSRSVGSRAEATLFGLRSFFSVRYYYIETGKESNFKAKGFSLLGRINGMTVYENDNYIPMGFTYDKFMTESDFDKISTSTRHMYLTSFLVVPDELADECSHYMTQVRYEDRVVMSSSSNASLKLYGQNCIDRAASACTEFEYDSYGFTAVTPDMESGNYVFFSVPYEEGWSATVNGKPAEIVKAFYGFIAVECPEGINTIEFEYETPGLRYGAYISLAGLAIWLLYMFVTRRTHRSVKSFFTDRYYENDRYDEELISSVATAECAETSDTGTRDETTQSRDDPEENS